MKIQVQDDAEQRRSPSPIKLKIASGDNYHVAVHVQRQEPQQQPATTATNRPISRPLQRSSFMQKLHGAVTQTRQTRNQHVTILPRPKVQRTIEIKVTLPHIEPLARVWRRFLNIPRRFRITGLAALLIVGLIVLGNPPVARHTTAAGDDGNLKNLPQLHQGTPTYSTLLPAGKNIGQLGGWTRISPPGRNAVFAYIDTLAGTQINVSQQPLPNNFKTNTASQVNQLAQSFNATEKVSAGGTDVYIGSSINGPQSIIFTKSNLLILIKSAAPVSNNDWISYVSSLN